MLVPSKYQKAIISWVRDKSGNGFVNAVAGSGKSTQINMNVEEIDPNASILVLAFNRHIKEAMAERMRAFRNVTVETFNSLGWKILRKSHGNLELRPNKTDILLRKRVNPDSPSYLRLRNPVIRMVSLLRHLNDVEASEDQILQHAKFYGVDLDNLKPVDDFIPLVRRIVQASVGMIYPCDFDDQVFQPIHLNLPMPEYDWIMVDESQDSSPLNIEMVCRLQEAKFGRVITVGDPDQSIYLFRGAHPKAMREYVTRLNATELPLNECYRCPDAVIEVAKRYVPRIEAPVPNPRGRGIVEENVTTPRFVREVQAGDVVLCRCTAPLVKRCLEQIRLGKRAYVKGRDLSDQLITLIEQIYGSADMLQRQYMDKTRYNRNPAVEDLQLFMDKLSQYRSERVATLERAGREAEAMNIDDRCETLFEISKEATYVVDLIIKIESIFSDDDDSEGIMFMTGHKAKGLEANRIWIIRPDLCPHPKSKTEDAVEQEYHLMYVMVTRSMAELRFVKKEKGEK